MIQGGYTEKYELEYILPMFKRNRKIGFQFNILYSSNKEVAYNSIDNKLEFFRAESDVLQKRFRLRGGIIFRPKLREWHFLDVFFHENSVADYVIQELNSAFFPQNSNFQRYFSLRYEYNWDNRDFIIFPHKGNYLALAFLKEGFGIFDKTNRASVQFAYKKYISLAERWVIENNAKVKVGLIRTQLGFFNNKAIGYDEDYLRGYELYVIDGLDFGYWKSSIHFKWLDKTFKLGKLSPLKAFKKIPVKGYISLNSDLGYANDPYYATDDPLTNQLLWGGGLGLNWVFMSDKIVRLEYSFNELGENGLFLHFQLGL